MSEAGEIPLEAVVMADEKEGEVVAPAAVAVVVDGQGDNGAAVVAKVDEEPQPVVVDLAVKPRAEATATITTAPLAVATFNDTTAKDDDDTSEDGEIDETPAAPKAAEAIVEESKPVEATKEETPAATPPLPAVAKEEEAIAKETPPAQSETSDSIPVPIVDPKTDVSTTKDEVMTEEKPTAPPKVKETTTATKAAASAETTEVKSESPAKQEEAVSTTANTVTATETPKEADLVPKAKDDPVAEDRQVEESAMKTGGDFDDAKGKEETITKPPPPPSPQAEKAPEAMDQELEAGSKVEESVETPKIVDSPEKVEETPPSDTKMNEKDVKAAVVEEKATEIAPMEVEEGATKEEALKESQRDAPSLDTIENKKDDEDGEIKEETKKVVETTTSAEENGEIKVETDEEGEIKEEEEDVEMGDALSQSDKSPSEDVDTVSNDNISMDGDADSVVEDPKKMEPSYSTRGRGSGTATPIAKDAAASGKGSTAGSAGSGGNNSEVWERSVRDALEGLGRGSSKETPSSAGPGGASFLEALGEEERRTRTRHLPAVDGIHMLRKNEIKGDMALARSIMSNAGNVASVASVAGTSTISGLAKKKSKKKDAGEPEAMETDDGNLSVHSEDDRSSDSGRVGSSTIDVEEGGLLALPSAAFVPPLAATQSVPNGEKNADGTPATVMSLGVKGILNNQRNTKSPRVVESVTAFNPPRPPESVGKKKQHRMLRWERRPADVEVDLNNYRKTVDRTRKELHTAEDQLERIESTSDHLRRHFLHHLRYMDQEYEQIMNEFDVVQQKCVNGADLLTSRTRTRGAGKGSHVMRDALAVLKARGAGVTEKSVGVQPVVSASTNAQKNYPGIGGVGGSSFSDWKHDSAIPSRPIASGWVLPGDKVNTPHGEGTVVKVFDTAALNVNEPPLEETIPKLSTNGQFPSKIDRDLSPASAKGANKGKSAASLDDSNATLCPRICVRFPFGVAYFSPDAVISTEFPNTFSDGRLSKRWKGLVETALAQSGQLDLEGMVAPMIIKKDTAGFSDASDSAETPIDTGEKKLDDSAEIKLLPFGSSLIPTGTGRGNKLCDIPASQLQKEFKPIFRETEGVLGDKANEGVPTAVKKFETQRQESYILQAKVLHLRNQLYRQTRIRTLNEKTAAATRDRSGRVESLVAEMRTDLKSLKNRLDEELEELGLDHDRANSILKGYYVSQENGNQENEEGDDSKKRSRDDPVNEKDAAVPEVDAGKPQTKRVKVTNQ